MNTNRKATLICSMLMLVAALLSPNLATAHCDGIDGPVVKAAMKALEKEDVNLVLIWVQKVDEPEIRQAFKRTLEVRKLNAKAKELADMYFFETLVRIHRAGEGAPYTGLKPAGRDLGPAIPLADEVLATGKVEPLAKFLADETRKELTERFSQALKARNHSSADLEAGREYVHAYVEFIHYVERAHEAATRPVTGHSPDGEHSLQGHEK